jgi:hypothetical protein
MKSKPLDDVRTVYSDFWRLHVLQKILGFETQQLDGDFLACRKELLR